MDASNHLQVRIAVAIILGTVGAAMMSRLPQLLPGQMPLPWYQDRYFLVGIIIVIIALLVLIIPPRHWMKLWYSVLGTPRWLYIRFMWIVYAPKYIISNPIIREVEVASSWVSAPPELHYKASFSISVKNKGMPMKLRLQEAVVFILQETEWGMRKTLQLGNLPAQDEKEFKPNDEGHWDLIVGTISGHQISPPTNHPNLKKKYSWGIQGIYVTLPKLGTKELHKGLYRKPVREYHVGIF